MGNRLHIIARPKLRDFIAEHPDSADWLNAWWKSVSTNRWESPTDVKASYPSVDRVGECYVFNVCHNKYRLIVRISFAYKENDGTVFVKHVLTHKEYDRDLWKEDCQ